MIFRQVGVSEGTPELRQICGMLATNTPPKQNADSDSRGNNKFGNQKPGTVRLLYGVNRSTDITALNLGSVNLLSRVSLLPQDMVSVFARPNMLLVELPTEILSVIFSCIPDRGCLVQIMQVCRLFRDMVEPLLYRSMHLQLPLTPTSRDSREGTCNLGHLPGLIGALSAQPRHSRLVKALYLQLDAPRDLDCNYMIKLSNLFPHLEELSLSPPSPHLDLTGMLFLKYLRLDFGAVAYYPQEVKLVLHPFWIPTLRILQIEWLELESQWEDLVLLQRHHMSPIIDLRIHASTDVDQSIGILTSLLNSVKSLKRFTLDAELDAAVSHVVQKWLSLDSILCALRFHADTLKDIVIAASDGGSICRTTQTCSYILFSSLRRLAIPISCLEYCKGSNCDLALPPKLEELQRNSKNAMKNSRLGIPVIKA